jgi:hypothetical protein
MEAPADICDYKSETQQHPNVRERKYFTMRLMKQAKLH